MPIVDDRDGANNNNNNSSSNNNNNNNNDRTAGSYLAREGLSVASRDVDASVQTGNR